jgi:hypothetical protein
VAEHSRWRNRDRAANGQVAGSSSGQQQQQTSSRQAHQGFSCQCLVQVGISSAGLQATKERTREEESQYSIVKMTFDEQAEHHHKKRQGAYQANKASTGPSTTSSSEKEKSVAAQEQQVVDRVPTDVMSVVTTPTTPALPGSVIRSRILATNSKKKQTESVTIHHHTDVYSQQEK